ncbi:metabotropic glutamate receptor 6-like [Uloborus diversus]|uniref:metabotropic glutamate receptor 6-like n=1 Tax=Uloborus diversus TaxID=327109 RepID=UPI00240A4197|nr:metabotropic glutamate receptor 6-like [Uloborus diversus]
MGLLVDVPKVGYGNTNDGITSRRFFGDVNEAAAITGIDLELILRFKIILEVISSGFDINVEQFGMYTMDTAKYYVNLYAWQPMSPTVHKILVHVPSIISHALLPIGQLSEEAAEARKKHFRQYREKFTRKISRKDCNEDVLNRLLLTSDPYLSSVRSSNMKRKRQTISKEAIKFLKSFCFEDSDTDDKKKHIAFPSQVEALTFQLTTDYASRLRLGCFALYELLNGLALEVAGGTFKDGLIIFKTLLGSMSNIDEGSYRCPDGSSPIIRHKKISGVLGAASSVTSIQVANLLRLFKIPQVSFFSTSPELSNKNRFEYFLRTVPSDTNQADAMVQIIQRLNWTYISILYEESTYGIQAFTVLEELLLRKNICLAVKERLTKDSGVAGESYYDNIVKRLMAKPNARGVIIFGSDQEVAGVMRAVRRNNATGTFTWIGSDGWSARSLVFEGNEDQVEGTLSVQPQAHPVDGFDDYFKRLTVQNNQRNPWFTEFWEHFFSCKWPGSAVTPYNQRHNNCTGKEIISSETGYEPERQLQFVSDSVLSFAYALKTMHKDLCGGRFGLCQKMKPIDGYTLLSYLKNVSFRGLSGDEFQFSEKGDGPARYNIIHFKQVASGLYKWVRVGRYEDGELELNFTDIQFRLDEPEMPTSVCSLPCSMGEAKKFVEGEECCWHCLKCSKYQVLKTETVCFECPFGYRPNEDHTECEEIPLRFMRINSGWAIGAMSFSSVGILSTIFTILVFIKHNNTPVVKASGRELSYVLLVGILMCYSMTFILVQEPTDVLCGAQQIGISLCFTIIYSALLTKTNRIARIFKAGARSAKRPSFISPKSQLFICGCITMVQLIISATWLSFMPPSAIHYYRTRDENHLVCAASVDATYMVAFAYPMLLIIICTVYAVLTRKIPEAFNESKFIGFTMYTTCIIWLAFIPIYFTTSAHAEINVFMMSATVSLSATVTLICLFSNKIYIILIHPEKNVRQSLMNTDRYNNPTTSSTRIEPGTVDESGMAIQQSRMQSTLTVNMTQCRNCGTQTTNRFLPNNMNNSGEENHTPKIARCSSCSIIGKVPKNQNDVQL